MIRLQEGRDTEVISGLCLYRAGRDEWVGAVEVSVVRFRPLDDRERERYLDSGRWEGKSGAYGVQDRDPFVSVVRGSFSNVVGLPMERLAELLDRYPAPDRVERSVLTVTWRSDPWDVASSRTGTTGG